MFSCQTSAISDPDRKGRIRNSSVIEENQRSQVAICKKCEKNVSSINASISQSWKSMSISVFLVQHILQRFSEWSNNLVFSNSFFNMTWSAQGSPGGANKCNFPVDLWQIPGGVMERFPTSKAQDATCQHFTRRLTLIFSTIFFGPLVYKPSIHSVQSS